MNCNYASQSSLKLLHDKKTPLNFPKVHVFCLIFPKRHVFYTYVFYAERNFSKQRSNFKSFFFFLYAREEQDGQKACPLKKKEKTTLRNFFFPFLIFLFFLSPSRETRDTNKTV